MPHNTWTWVDGSPIDLMYWGQSQPSTGENFVSLRTTDGKWHGEDLFQVKPYICAVKMDPPIKNCEHGWIYYQPTHSCFGISFRGQKQAIVRNWEEAKEYCNNQYADLPSFHDVNEFYVLQAFIISAMQPIWVGLQSIDNSNTWSWSDGSIIDYLPWYKDKGFPVTMAVSCGMAQMSFITNQDCNARAWVICKKPSY